MTTSPTTTDTDTLVPQAADDPAWITATVRPAGTFGRRDVGRLRALLDALSACASIVVLDLGAARLRSPRAVEVIDDAARRLEASGGCLLCLNADPEARLALHPGHAVLLEPGEAPPTLVRR
jgi:hypothetical protein